MKNTITLTLAAALALTLGACNRGAGSNNSAGSSNATNAAAPAADANSSANADKPSAPEMDESGPEVAKPDVVDENAGGKPPAPADGADGPVDENAPKPGE